MWLGLGNMTGSEWGLVVAIFVVVYAAGYISRIGRLVDRMLGSSEGDE